QTSLVFPRQFCDCNPPRPTVAKWSTSELEYSRLKQDCARIPSRRRPQLSTALGRQPGLRFSLFAINASAPTHDRLGPCPCAFAKKAKPIRWARYTLASAYYRSVGAKFNSCLSRSDRLTALLRPIRWPSLSLIYSNGRANLEGGSREIRLTSG